MLEWKQNPMDAFDRQIELGKSMQMVAAMVLKELADKKDLACAPLQFLSEAIINGAQLERDAIREKIELHGDQESKRAGTHNWCILRDEKSGWAAATKKDPCCCDPEKPC